MKKILPLLIISIIVISGLSISAAPLNKEIKNNPQKVEDWNLEITLKGGNGYTAKVTNTGTAQIAGNLTIQVHTEPMLILKGKDLEVSNDIAFNPDDTETYKIKPVLGIGPGNINLDVVFLTDTNDYIVSDQTNGFVFLFLIFCSSITINVP